MRACTFTTGLISTMSDFLVMCCCDDRRCWISSGMLWKLSPSRRYRFYWHIGKNSQSRRDPPPPFPFSPTMFSLGFHTLTYIYVLDEEMLAGFVPLHGEHVTWFVLTLPHQEVPAVLQQLLHLQSGNGTVVPVLLFQRRKHLEAGGEGKQ